MLVLCAIDEEEFIMIIFSHAELCSAGALARNKDDVGALSGYLS
jgi:hypothetical protein